MALYYADCSYHTDSALRPPREPTLADRVYRCLAGWLMHPLTRYVPEDQSLRVLDVGCARGDYLARLKAAGFTDLWGIEPSREAVQGRRDRSLNIVCIALAAFETTERFDLITLNQVFEHCEDPRTSLEQLRQLLRPGGTLVMSFPNYRSLARWLFRGFWPGYDAPRHYYCFAPGNIRLLAKQCGMEVLRIRYISRPSQFLGSLQYLWNRFSHEKQRLEDGAFRNCRTLDLLLYPLAYLLNFLRLGDLIEVHLRAIETTVDANPATIGQKDAQDRVKKTAA